MSKRTNQPLVIRRLSVGLLLPLLAAVLAGAAVAADWPGYRGPYRDGICKETGLPRQWPPEGPKPLWRSTEIGEGYSGLAVHGSMGYTMGQRDGREWVIAMDVVNMLRIQRERMHGALLPSNEEYTELFGLTVEREKRMKPDAIVMHPGPMNRGVEIAPEVADGKRSVILEQVTNGVAVRMAVLSLVETGD